ncbi:MAG TPA: NAD-dependent epimerase/dehydratase family protein [Stellaceae bacterium]
MRVFLAGATGVVGSSLLSRLVAAGHSVVGQTRTPGKAKTIRRLGGTPVVADGLDSAALRNAVIAARPDVVIHEMTGLGDVTDYRRFDRTFATTNRLRREDLDTLLASAKDPVRAVSSPRVTVVGPLLGSGV